MRFSASPRWQYSRSYSLYGVAFEVGDDEARVGALDPVFEPRDHTALVTPGLGRVAELADEPLLDVLLGIVVGQGRFGQLDRRVQPGIARQADDVAHA